MPNFDFTQAVQADPGLTESQKEHLTSETSKHEIEEFLSGTAGAATAVAIGKYLKLSKPVQVVLGVLGYGAGKILFDNFTSRKPVTNFNEKTKAYELDSKRY